MEKTLVKDLYPDYVKYLKTEGRSPKTIKEHMRFLESPILKAVGNKRVVDLVYFDVGEVKEATKQLMTGAFSEQRSVCTYRLYLAFLEKFMGFRLSFDWRDIKLPRVRKKHVVEYLNEEELDAVLGVFDCRELAGLRTRALLEVIFSTGARISEAIQLNRWGENSIDRSLDPPVAIVTNVKVKEDFKTLYFSRRCLYWVDKYLERRDDKIQALFISGRGRLLPVSSRNYVRAKTKDLPFNKKICHTLFRKSRVTKLIQQGANIRDVQQLSGHRSVKTTLNYYAGMSRENAKHVFNDVLNKEGGKQKKMEE